MENKKCFKKLRMKLCLLFLGIVNILFLNIQKADAQDSLFISEYCGGNPNYAWLEFYNPSSETLNLEGYKILTVPQWVTGFANTSPAYTFNLGGKLAPGTVYVIANNTCPPEVRNIADTLLIWNEKVEPEPWQHIARFYNGDESVGLFYNDTLVDIIGDPNASPRLAWDVAGVTAATNQYTLLRKPEISHGNTDWDESRGTDADNSEWLVAGKKLTGYAGFYPGKAEITSDLYSIIPYSEKLIYKYRIEKLASKTRVAEFFSGMFFAGLNHKVLNVEGSERELSSYIETGDRLVALTARGSVYRSFGLVLNSFEVNSSEYLISGFDSDTGKIEGVPWNIPETDFLKKLEKGPYVNWDVLPTQDHPRGIITRGDLLEVYDSRDTFTYIIYTLAEPLHTAGLTSTSYYVSSGHDIDTISGIVYRTDTLEFKSRLVPSEGAGCYVKYGKDHPPVNEIISGDTLYVVAEDKTNIKKFVLNVKLAPDSVATILSDIYTVNSSQDTLSDILAKTSVSTVLSRLSKAPLASWSVSNFYLLPVDPVAFVRTGFNLKVVAEDGTVRVYKLMVREREVQEIAQLRNLPPMSPRYSDVVLRNLLFRPVSSSDPYNTLTAIKDFHATRLEWVYLQSFSDTEKNRINQVKDLGVLFGAASSGSTFHSPIPKQELWKEKIDGTPPVPSWMIDWPNPGIFCCMNKPGFIEGNLAYFKDLIDLGDDVIQRDGPYSTGYLSCFCNYCMPALTQYLKDNYTAAQFGLASLDSFNYKDYLISKGVQPDDVHRTQWNTPLYTAYTEFQLSYSADFHKYISKEIDKYAGRHVSRSCNNGGRWNEVTLQFDYGFTEIVFRDVDPLTLYSWCKTSIDHGKQLIIGKPNRIPPHYTNAQIVSLVRRFGGVITASGGNFRVPFDVFDVYEDLSTAPRYFGLPSEYADMFGFIRGLSEYLDGYEDAAVLMKNYTDKRYDGDFPVSVADPLRNIVAIVRCKPGDKEGAKVIHLVDWNPSGSFKFRIKGDAFFPGYQLKVKLFTPKPYNASAHALAENEALAILPPDEKRGPGQAAAYKRLVDSLELSVSLISPWSEVEIPALGPWGILVVEKGKPLSELVPVAKPEFIMGATSSRYKEAGSVIYSATAANSTDITYTIDSVSLVAGNSIVKETGELSYVDQWIGTTVITAIASGFNGPATAIHIANTTTATQSRGIIRKELVIYPNPFESFLRIEGIGSCDKIQILSIEGKAILEMQLFREESVILQTADILPGIYLVKIDAENTAEFRKLIKLR